MTTAKAELQAMPYQISAAVSYPRLYRPGQWPGERRHPTRWDTHDAVESPAAAFLERFRVALIHSEGPADDTGQDSAPMVDNREPAATVSQRHRCLETSPKL